MQSGWPLQPRISRAQSGRRAAMMLRPLPWASLIRISLAPAAMAPSQAATTSAVISSRNSGYVGCSLRASSQLVIPATPSMSALI